MAADEEGNPKTFSVDTLQLASDVLRIYKHLDCVVRNDDTSQR